MGSTAGNLYLDAGRDVGVMASSLLAQDGNISVVGRDVDIVAGLGQARQQEYHAVKQSSLTIGIGGEACWARPSRSKAR